MAQAQPNLTTDPGARFERCVDEAHAILRKAADEWALGHPEQRAKRSWSRSSAFSSESTSYGAESASYESEIHTAA
jgi:hypothetical protein